MIKETVYRVEIAARSLVIYLFTNEADACSFARDFLSGGGGKRRGTNRMNGGDGS